MWHEALAEYLTHVEHVVLQLKNVYVERYEEEILTAERANLRIRIRFEEGHLLEINEAVVVEGGMLLFPGYRYHFQDKQAHLIFRCDNTRHFPDLPSHPHHKHLRGGVVAGNRPDIDQVIRETAERRLSRQADSEANSVVDER